jgi:rubrerythrin
MKDMLELLQEFAEYGYVLHECPECGEECEPTEIDSDKAYCPVCDEVVTVSKIL